MRVAAALIVAFAAAIAGGAETRDGIIASADRAKFPPADWPFLYYASTQRIDSEEGRESAAIAFRFVVASLSPSASCQSSTPQPVDGSPTLFRLDLRQLGFSVADWRRIIERDPYKLNTPPLVARADWLLIQLTDAQENDGLYLPLAFGGVKPKTRDEAIKLLGVNSEIRYRVPFIESQSGVSVQGTRWIESRVAPRGWAWGTRDVLSLEANKDPAEQPEGDFTHDGEEWLIGRMKVDEETGAMGALQFGFLANGKGAIVNRAPVDLVEDHGQFRGLAEIRSWGSCIGCHRSGAANTTTQNLIRQQILSGVDRYAEPKEYAKISALLTDLDREFTRAGDDAAVASVAVCGVEPAAASARFQLATTRYDEPVTLERAAHELYTTPEKLTRALALSSEFGGNLTARIAGLAHGLPMPRRAFEQAWFALWQTVQKWESKK